MYALRHTENPERFFQKGRITSKTVFLRYIQKDDDGYHASWIWCDKADELGQFLLQVVVFSVINKEFDLLPKDDVEDIEKLNLEDLLGFGLTKTLMGQEGLSADVFAGIAQGDQVFVDALNHRGDLNLSSQLLMNQTSSLFYSLTWNFYTKDEAFALLKNRLPFESQKPTGEAFCRDTQVL